MLKRILILVYSALVVTMAIATIVEKYHGTGFAQSHIYASWWFSTLWAVLAAVGIAWIVRRRMRKAYLLTLHLSLVVILAGALLTHLTSRSGMIHLREGMEVRHYEKWVDDDSTTPEKLPFSLRLEWFDITYHEGTSSVSDYVSHIKVSTPTDTMPAIVSMNNIFSGKGVRLYQNSFDTDGKGTFLTVSIDPWGITVSYLGYALLFVSLIWMLITPQGTFRKLLSDKRLGTTVILMLLSIGWGTPRLSAAPHVLPETTAEQFGRLHQLYNGRISQLQTYALDFTKKLCGKRNYNGYSAEQVLTGFIFYHTDWSHEPLIKVKSSALRERLGIGKEASVDDFFGKGDYILGPLLQEYYQGQQGKLHKDALELDDKLQLIFELRQEVPLKLFPYSSKEGLKWYSPADKLPQDMEESRQQYIHTILPLLREAAKAGRHSVVDEGIGKISGYQKRYGGTSLPSHVHTWAERLYNGIPFTTLLFMLNLGMAIVSLFAGRLSRIVLVVSALLQTLVLALRWIISGNVPMSNGYETMLLMAWIATWLAIAMARRARIMVTFGFLTSGFFLLVSHLGQLNPQISHLMPVLNSPLLSIHVSIIMLAYTLLSMTFACGVTALLRPQKALYLQWLSMLFLYPSLSALGIGIFTGAIWANISWGTYWSWDPKETWALITLMTYAVAAHRHTLPSFQRARSYHLFMVLAFLTLLMTYFGVNYFLGGMHSYA